MDILKLYAIYVPHITEYIYLEFFRQHEKTASIHLLQWVKPASVKTDIIEYGDLLKNVIFEMRKYKSERNLSQAEEMDVLEIVTDQRFANWFNHSEKDLKACSKAKTIIFTNQG